MGQRVPRSNEQFDSTVSKQSPLLGRILRLVENFGVFRAFYHPRRRDVASGRGRCKRAISASTARRSASHASDFRLQNSSVILPSTKSSYARSCLREHRPAAVFKLLQRLGLGALGIAVRRPHRG